MDYYHITKDDNNWRLKKEGNKGVSKSAEIKKKL